MASNESAKARLQSTKTMRPDFSRSPTASGVASLAATSSPAPSSNTPGAAPLASSQSLRTFERIDSSKQIDGNRGQDSFRDKPRREKSFLNFSSDIWKKK
eukprot:TRINITY_DN1690_c0_g1_i3.p1 TRINITY_DN1690_c0_g1~~TRINITY_DN1690_c0_g1_i3.p1  ORF type:complete len:100 (-),score=13.44 TRINITY_DN1690_c0_g1_i3:5-304(-)